MISHISNRSLNYPIEKLEDNKRTNLQFDESKKTNIPLCHRISKIIKDVYSRIIHLIRQLFECCYYKVPEKPIAVIKHKISKNVTNTCVEKLSGFHFDRLPTVIQNSILRDADCRTLLSFYRSSNTCKTHIEKNFPKKLHKAKLQEEAFKYWKQALNKDLHSGSNRMATDLVCLTKKIIPHYAKEIKIIFEKFILSIDHFGNLYRLEDLLLLITDCDEEFGQQSAEVKQHLAPIVKSFTKIQSARPQYETIAALLDLQDLEYKNLFFYHTILTYIKKKSQVSQIEEIVKKYSSENLNHEASINKPHIIAIAVVAYCRIGCFKHALQLVESHPNVIISIKSLNLADYKCTQDEKADLEAFLDKIYERVKAEITSEQRIDLAKAFLICNVQKAHEVLDNIEPEHHFDLAEIYVSIDPAKALTLSTGLSDELRADIISKVNANESNYDAFNANLEAILKLDFLLYPHLTLWYKLQGVLLKIQKFKEVDRIELVNSLTQGKPEKFALNLYRVDLKHHKKTERFFLFMHIYAIIDSYEAERLAKTLPLDSYTKSAVLMHISNCIEVETKIKV